MIKNKKIKTNSSNSTRLKIITKTIKIRKIIKKTIRKIIKKTIRKIIRKIIRMLLLI